MSRPVRHSRIHWLLVLALATVFIGGCTMVQPRSEVDRTARTQHPLVAQASVLAQSPQGADAAAIQALLAQLDDATLSSEAAALAQGDPLYNHMGRELLRRGIALPRPLDRAAWQFDAGSRPPADNDGYRPPMKVSVLLPLSGDLARAAEPVRDGFLAGYFHEHRRRPEVSFIDTHGTSGGALAAYDEAVAAASDFIVGPLGRDEVDALFRRGNLSVPVLALNRGDVDPPAGNASFALSPEDEGSAAADFLAQQGARRVLVVSGGDAVQRRSVDAFRTRLAELGGEVTDVATSGIADLTPFATREGGIDAVFLAIRGNTARELMPRLAMAGLAGKPRVATSHLLQGTGEPAEDRVLDGTAFPGEHWTSGGHIPGLPSADSAAQTLPTARGGAARLFAFGHDAWLLTAYLEKLTFSAASEVRGATGMLSIDELGHVRRTPAWSTFSAGVPVTLDNAGRY